MESAQARLISVFEALGITPNAFAKMHTMNVPTIYGIVSGARSPGFNILAHICKAEPRISAEYLLRGEGEPLRDEKLATALTTVDELRALKEHVDAAIEKRIQELSQVSEG